MKISAICLVIAGTLVHGAALAQGPGAAPPSPPPPPPAQPPVAPAPALPVAAAANKTPMSLTFGGSLGAGSLRADCDECRSAFEAFGLSGHVGLMLTPRLAVMVDLWGMVHVEGFLTVYQNINTLAGQFWLTPRLWLRAGVGNANAGYHWRGIFRDYEDRTEAAPGVMVGAGYEFAWKGHAAFEVQLRYGTGFYDVEIANEYVIEAHSVHLGIGMSVY